MIEIVPFKAEHLEGLMLQRTQQFFQSKIDNPEFRADTERSVYAKTGMLDGVPFGAAGIYPQTEWLGLGWCLFGTVPKYGWTRVFRECKRGVEWATNNGFSRVEALVACGFMPGVRLAHMVGMKYEAFFSGYMPDGSGVWQYVRLVDR